MDADSVVVDGSNIATEGRSTPSLAQLDDAVREFQSQFPRTRVIVVVDATFGHRIDRSERQAFDEAIAHGEIVSPPAGAIGRGDAFLLKAAERVGAQVLSNDSFQEFHGEHPWLFEPGRLMGGTPVPGVGWIFTPRLPVRGTRSRGASVDGRATKAKLARVEQPAPRKRASSEGSASRAAKAVKSPKTAKPAKPAKSLKTAKSAKSAKSSKVAKSSVPVKAVRSPKAAKGPKKVESTKSTKTATKADRGAKSTKPAEGTRGSKATKRKASNPVQPTKSVKAESARKPPSQKTKTLPGPPRSSAPPASNDPLTFLRFVTDHPLGSRVKGRVVSFTSHGAKVDVGDMHCYVPLQGLGDPAPRSARDVLESGETRSFVLMALDPPRRSAELALPKVARR